MVLNWNEIKSRALRFSKTWADASNEDSQAKPFWPGALLVEHKPRGKNLDDAVDQAIGYLPNQPSGGKKIYATNAKRVAFLFDLYQRITSLLPAAKPSSAIRQSKVPA
jgi:hypothetical protein